MRPLQTTVPSPAPSLQLVWQTQSHSNDSWSALPSLFQSQRRTIDDKYHALTIYGLPNYKVAHFPYMADFYIDAQTITAHVSPHQDPNLIESTFLKDIMAMWLETQLYIVLHASSVLIDKYAVGFIAQSGQGKTSLAASFVQANYPLVTDDMLALQITTNQTNTLPGYQWMRVNDEQITQFIGSKAQLEPVMANHPKKIAPVGSGWGQMATNYPQLACLYLPERVHADIPIKITPLSAREALISLVTHSFAANAMHAFDLVDSRFQRLNHLIKQVPVRKLQYPHGWHHLPHVRTAIIDDVYNLARG